MEGGMKNKLDLSVPFFHFLPSLPPSLLRALVLLTYELDKRIQALRMLQDRLDASEKERKTDENRIKAMGTQLQGQLLTYTET